MKTHRRASWFNQILYLFHKFNAGLEIHTEIHEDPVNTFLFVLFLFKYEHVVVEKLLQLLVGEVDAKLLEAVELNRYSNKHFGDKVRN